MPINQIYRDRKKSIQSELSQLSDEDLDAMIAQKQKQSPALGSRLGAGLSTAPHIFGQMGGLKTPEMEKNDINTLMMREYVKNMYKPTEQTINVIDPATGQIKTTTAPAGKVVTGRETLEGRLEEEQGLRQKRFQFDRLDNFGGEINQEGIDDTNKTLGFDITPELEAGRGIPTIDRDGNRRYRVLSQEEWKRKVAEGKWDNTEIEHMQKIKDETTKWDDVVNGLSELGITADTAGKIEFDVVNSPIGPLSIPARFNLAGQYMQDPKYTALKKKIERAFQAFRSRVTGAQAATSELKLLRPLIASLKDRPEVFFQTIKDLQFEENRAGETRLDIYRRAGRDISQFQGLFNIDETIPTSAGTGNQSIPTSTSTGLPQIGQSFQGGKVKAIRLKR